MSINFNTAPYFDDYDEEKKFVKILYRPGVAVQTRELNQLQTQIQNQIDRFGQGIYKDGSMVIPGGISYNRNFNYVKLTGTFSKSEVINGANDSVDLITEDIDEELLKISTSQVASKVTGLESGVTGIVKWYQLETDDSPLTLYVEYDDSGANSETQAFLNGESLLIEYEREDQNDTNYVEYYATTASVDATGFGSAAEIERGVYFTKGYFVLVDKQTLILDPYSNTPSYSVGLKINESIITPEEDETLNDNANGSFNFAAPGAHRYRVQLDLTKIPLAEIENQVDDNYIELLQTKNGKNEKHEARTSYSELGKELARRTYDESGDYTVSSFRMSAVEGRNNDRGEWANGVQYLAGDVVISNGNTYVAVANGISGGTAPSHTEGEGRDGTGGVTWSFIPNPKYNNGHLQDGREDQIFIAFEPGKAYVRGYEIEKPSTTYVAIDKARTFEQVNNDVIRTDIGNYIEVQNLKGVPNVTSFVEVDLKDSGGNIVTTARIRAIEPSGSEKYFLYLFDIKPIANDALTIDRDVKEISNDDFSSIVSNVIDGDGQGNVDFQADSTTSGNAIVNGNGTRFTRDFKAGDYIEINDTFYTIDEIISDTELVLDLTYNSGNAISGISYKIHRTVIKEPSRLVSLFPLGRSFIKSVRDESEGVQSPDTRYVVVQSVEADANNSGVLTVSISDISGLTGQGNERVGTEQDLVLCKKDSEELAVDLSASNINVTLNDTSITIGGLIANETYVLFFPVVKNTPSTASPKIKELVRFHSMTPIDYESRVISLDKADIYRIRKIEMAGPTEDSPSVDVTDHFDLDNGQRDTYYDLGKIVRKPNYGVPTGELTIYFDYFEHSGTGDYFCVDSYLDVKREEIPLYSSIYGIVYLADVLDFRPRINDSGTGFTGSGASLSLPPKRGRRTEVDYTYYLPRIDKISLDIEGKFVVTNGTPGDTATQPETPDMSMHMATITLAPYTFNTNYVTVEKVDNRRYTMRDIGKIEKRLENLEYYTSLSLLEQQASTLNIPDESGLDKFKNGFIVDNFAGHTTGDVASSDYKASIDMEMKELRPTFIMDNVKLLEKAKTNTERKAQGYQITGDIITLPYTENEFIYQRYASRPENVNPFAIFTFIGSVELNPPSDEWIETQRIPEVINDVEGNFSSVLSAQRESGALGTVWNAWQTQWTGQIVTGSKMVRAGDWSKQDFGLGAGRWMARNTFTAAERELVGNTPGGRVLTYEVVANQSGQTRTGTNTEVRATLSKEFVNDRVISTSVVPFIRSRKIAFLARGLKLQTIVHPFFDEVNISKYITPASRITFTSSGLFDYVTNVGQDNDEVSRRIDNDVQTALNKGDVIYVKERAGVTYNTADSSLAAGVCVLQEVQPGGDKNVLIIPTKGEFLVGDIIKGTISGTEGTVTAYDRKQQGNQLVTNFGGDVAGIFDIPNTNALRFPTGNREFKLIDNLDNNDLTAKTRGFGNYHAEGVLQTWQATYNSVRNAEVVRTTVTDERTIVTDERVGRLIRDTGWYDPLAQTFLVQNRGGAFITSVDVWIASVDPVKPITMQIREVVNGYPGKNILPFSNISLYPHELREDNQPPGYGFSANTIEVDGGLWLAPDRPVKFKMKAPVYVQDVGEYCIVLLSNSNNYHVWTSELGGIDVTTSTPRLISEQPYAGVLFKSQNASTWTAHQNEDLMFRINIAEFETEGSAEFVNAKVNNVTLNNDPFFFRVGSTHMRVFHANHGLYNNAKVTISNVASGEYNGVSSSAINGEHTVVHVEQDAYVVQLNGIEPTLTGRTGGTGVRASRNVKFDVLQPIIQQQKFADTGLTFLTRTTSGKSIHGSQAAGDLSNYIPITVNENNEFVSPRMVTSEENESNGKSFFLKANMSTTNTSLSPVIDSARTSLITVSNRIDDPTVDNMNQINLLDVYNLFSIETTNLSFSGNTITTTNSGIAAAFRSLRVGKQIKVVNGLNDDEIRLITNITDDGLTVTVNEAFEDQQSPPATQIVVYDNYVDEIGPRSSSSAKYLTRKINFSGSAATSTSLNVRFAAQVPSGARVDIYYKIAVVGDSTEFSELTWVYMGTVGVNNVMTDQSLTRNGLPEFNAASIKLVMNSTNSAAVPKIKDLVVIATV